MEYISRSQSVRSLFASACVLAFGIVLGSLLMPSAAHAAALTSTNVEPASLVAGSTSTVTVTFTTATNIPNDGKIKVTFPTNFDVSGLTAPVNCTGLLAGGVSFSAAGQVATVTLNGTGATTTAPASVSCTLPGIRNPRVSGSTGTYTIETTDSLNAQLDVDAAVTADTIVAATLTSTNVQPVSLRTRTVNNVTVSFTTVNPLANTDKIKITFPSGFNAFTLGSGTCSATMNGSFSTNTELTVDGWVVTITRSAGDTAAAGAHTCTLTNITNPTNVGAGGTYRIATTSSSDAVRDQDTAVSSDNFTSSSSADDEDVVVTYSVNLLTPEDGDSFAAGTMTDITWESDGGSASYVNLSYSEDGGTTWQTIVTNSLNDGEYIWTVPHIDSDEVVVKVATTDLATELATDTSAAFSVWYSTDEGAVVDGDEETTDETLDEDMPEDIDGIMTGDYIKLEGGSTIYYVDSSMMRRPFFDAQTYFTYEDDFDAVVEVSADTMAQFAIGAPMLPQAGVVLVKIQSVAKVYMVEEAADGSSTLRWITSEEVAQEMFGSPWNSYVIDVDATLFTRYEEGDDVDSAEDVDTDMMKYRTDLHE